MLYSFTMVETLLGLAMSCGVLSRNGNHGISKNKLEKEEDLHKVKSGMRTFRLVEEATM